MKRFELGRIVASPGAIEAVTQEFLLKCIVRHAKCDWGDLSTEDKVENDLAVRVGGLHIFSSYKFPGGKLWVITEADRSVTTALMPEDC